MKTELDLLKEAESLINQAEQRINELNALTLENDIKEELLPVAEKFAEVNRVLDKKKGDILAILIKLTLLTRRRTCHTCFGACFDYEIRNQNEIEVCRGDIRGRMVDRRGHYSLGEFVACRELDFRWFCDWMWRVLRDFLVASPFEQEGEIKILRAWDENLKELEKELADKNKK